MNVFHLRFSLVVSVKVSQELLMQTCWWPLSDHWSVQAHLTSLVWVCVLWLPWKLNGAICAMWFALNSSPPGENGRHFADDSFNAFSWMKSFLFRLKFHWSLFQLTIFQHWFRQWLSADQATSHHLNHWWLDYRRIYASLDFNELKVDEFQQHYFPSHKSISIPAWISNYIHYKVWGEVTYPS